MDAEPEFLTLGQAARASNRSKATISRAVRSGRLPAKAAEDNAAGWLIRREDLDRVFPPQVRETVTQPLLPALTEDVNRQEAERLRIEVEGLRERLQVTEQRLADTATTVADLRTERDRLLGVIEAQAAQRGRRGFWRRLFRRR
jgi:helix-turn-helix protein